MNWNISNFISWFIQQVFNIGSDILNKADHIILYGNITLLDFMVTIIIIGAFITIVTTAPRLGLVQREVRKKGK